MDYASRRAWGKVTGLKYGLIKYNYTIDPVFEVVDLKTGLTTTQTAFVVPDRSRDEKQEDELGRGEERYLKMCIEMDEGTLKPTIDYTLED